MSQIDYETRKSYLKLLKLNGFGETFEKNVVSKISYQSIYEQEIGFKVEVHLNQFEIMLYAFRDGVEISRMTCLYKETFEVFQFIKQYI
jgi:hypothetical protein